MKKTRIFLAVLTMVVAMALAITGCEKKNAAETASRTEEVTVRLLTDSTGIDDKSYNASAWRGILDFYGDSWDSQTKRGLAYDVITAQTEDMYLPNLMQVTDEGYDLIVVAGFTFEAPLVQVAGNNPGQKYLIVDVGLEGDFPNVMQAAYAEHEGSYLVGAAAALKAKEDGIVNPRFGFIGGVPDPVITKFEVGFVQGVLSVLPGAGFIDYYVNSWDEPALAKTQAKNWFDIGGVYAIYSAAGHSGNGVIAQAKEYRLAGRNVWAIGVDSDQYEEGLYSDTESAVLTSMLKRVETSLVYALEAVQNNTFEGELITFDLVQEGVGYSTANAALSNSIVIQLEAIKQQIISGEIVIAQTYEDAKRLPGFPQNLKALDN